MSDLMLVLVEGSKLPTVKELRKELHKCLSENNLFAIETTISGKYLIKYILQAQQKG